MTLGSLFDGSGGFPLGAILCGITPVWAAEVEPYPIKVTKTRIPFMKHIGNVTEIDGANVYETDVSRTISTNGNSPEANQGGVAIVSSFSQDAYDKYTESDVSATLKSCGGSYGGGSEMIVTTKCKPKYTVRKLTPIECARLQGFPDWWCDDLENTNPSEEDMEFWRRVFETYYTINGKKTVKTDKQIVKWLSSDNGDSAKYKMWGNGVALPNVIFVLSGIAEWSEDGNELLCSDEETNNG